MDKKSIIKDIAKSNIDKAIMKQNLIEHKGKIELTLSLLKESEKIEDELFELMQDELTMDINPSIQEIDLTGDDEEDLAIDSYIDEVITGNAKNTETGQSEPIFQVKGSNLLEDEDDMEEVFSEFEMSQKNGVPDDEGFSGDNDFEVDTTEDEMDKNTDWYAKAGEDLFEVMDENDAKNLVDDAKNSEKLQESLSRMKVLAKLL